MAFHSPIVHERGTLVPTRSGGVINIDHPDWKSVYFRADVAPALGQIARFSGQTASGPYSVAQHCVLGARAILRETNRVDLAVAFLLHDAAEAYLGDLKATTRLSMERRLAGVLHNMSGPERQAAIGSHNAAFLIFDAAEAGLVKAVEIAAGLRPKPPADLAATLPAGLPDAEADAWLDLYRTRQAEWRTEESRQADLAAERRPLIATMDLRMLRTERDHLCLNRDPAVWGKAVETAKPVQMRGAIKPWSWEKAADEWLGCLNEWCPSAATA